jgi:putative methyltransferase (TIGR01177 family)
MTVQPPLPSSEPFLVRLAGRRVDLAAFEVRATAHVLRESRRLVVATGDADRLAAVTHVFEYLGAATPDVLPFHPRDVVRGTHAVHISTGRNDRALAAHLQALVWRALPSPNVDLRAPDVELHGFVVGAEVWWGRLLHRVKPGDFAERDVGSRPFARSIGIPARTARCLVNLSGIRPGQSLLDPFCGTGSVLIEAALLGAEVYGSDVGWPLVRGTRRNLEHYGLDGRVERRDVRESAAWGRVFDAIVTDVPYGRSASLHGASPQELYGQFLLEAGAILAPRGRAVVVSPKGALPMPVPGLRLLASFDEYVHGTLTRTVSVFGRGESG